MSERHVRNEFARICIEYTNMKNVMRELEEELANNVISEERYKELIAPIEVMKANYMRWSYMIHLLDLSDKIDNTDEQVKCQAIEDDSTSQDSTSIKNEDLVENKKLLQEFKHSIDCLKKSE